MYYHCGIRPPKTTIRTVGTVFHSLLSRIEGLGFRIRCLGSIGSGI